MQDRQRRDQSQFVSGVEPQRYSGCHCIILNVSCAIAYWLLLSTALRKNIHQPLYHDSRTDILSTAGGREV